VGVPHIATSGFVVIRLGESWGMSEVARRPFLTPTLQAHGRRLVAAVEAGDGSILVTGEAMVGKSFLVRHWLKGVARERLLRLDLESLGSRSPVRQVGDHLEVGPALEGEALARACSAALAGRPALTVVVESAERLPEWVWQQLLTLYREVTGLHYLWIGRLDVKQRMEASEYRPLAAAIIHRVHLLAYSPEESERYCREYLGETAPEIQLSPEAHGAVYGFALGYLPNTERVLDEAVALARSQGRAEIKPLMVRVAIDALRGTSEWRPPGARERRGCAPRAALIVAGLAGLAAAMVAIAHLLA
jgi:hypothetical protein